MNANVIRKLQSPNFKISRFSYLKLTKSFYLFIYFFFFLLHFGILSLISGSRNINILIPFHSKEFVLFLLLYLAFREEHDITLSLHFSKHFLKNDVCFFLVINI